jgi:pimeloyl-ACP methyl ester carboxylesterase
MRIFRIGVLAFFLGICMGDSPANPELLTKPYVPPWAGLPDTPSLPTAIKSGQVHVDNETAIWYGFYGQQLSDTLDCGQIPVLFLHGGFANSDYFGNQIRALRHLPFTLMVIDSRGQGRSTDGSGPITYDRMTGDVLAVLDHFQIPKVALVGWSDGAIIGFDIAMNHSSRLDRLFSFGGSYSFSNGNATLETNPIFNTYLQRTELEYTLLNPNPEHWPELSAKMNEMWSTLPVWDQESFSHIPTLYSDQSAPLVWILDGDSEEVVNRTVPAVLHDWVRNHKK